MPRKKKTETEDVLEKAEEEVVEALESSDAVEKTIEKEVSKKETKKIKSEKDEKPTKLSKSKKLKVEKQTLSDKEFEKKVLDLGKSGLTSEKIGEQLRREGIHPKEHLKKGRKISHILKENNLYTQPDLKNINDRFTRLKAHLEKNKQDKRVKREVVRVQSQLKKAKSYFKVSN